MSYQLNGKWYYTGSTVIYASEGAANYYGPRDSTYVSYGLDPTKSVENQTPTVAGTTIKTGSPEAWAFYGLDPITGTIPQKDLETLKTGYLSTQGINKGTNSGHSTKAHHEITDEEARLRGINRIFGGKDYRAERKKERKAANKKARIEAGPNRVYAELGLSKRNNPYSYENPNFPRLPSEIAAREVTQRENTLLEVGYGGQVNYTPQAIQLLQERRARREQTVLKMEYQKEYGNINPQISEAAYRPMNDLGTTEIQGTQRTNQDTAREIVAEAKREGATKIQIYNKEGKPVGAIGMNDAENVLTGLLNTGEIGYRFSKPKEKYVREVKEDPYVKFIGGLGYTQPSGQKYTVESDESKFNRELSSLTGKGAIIDIYDKQGNKVGETSGQRSRYDIMKATQKYGEVQVKHHYTNDTLYNAIANAPNTGIGVTNIGGYKFAYPDVYEAGANFVKNLALEVPRLGGMLASGFVKSGGRYFGQPEQDYGINEITNKFVVENRGETALGIITSGEPNTRSKSFLATSLGLDIASMVLPFKAKIPFVNVARFGETEVVTVSIGERVKPLFSIAQGKISKGFDITSIGKQGFKNIAESYNVKAKGGAEIDALGETASKILTSEKSLKKLQMAGILTKQDVMLIKAGKVAVKESSKLPNKVFRDLGNQPFENIKAGKETQATKEFFKENKIVVEGSAIDIPTFLDRYVSQAGDFDVKVKNNLLAKQLGESYVEKLKPTLPKGTELKAEGSKSIQIIRYEFDKKVGKVGEFLSEEDDATGQLSKTGKVFGIKTDTGKMIVEGIKMKTGKFQINRRIASITSMQPKGAGIEISPPINKPGIGTTRAKDFPRAYAGIITRAFIARSKGQIARALKLEQAAATIKLVGSKKINFDEFFKSRKTVGFIHEGETPPSNLISNVGKGSIVSSSLISRTPSTKIENPPPPTSEAFASKESPIIREQSRVNKSYAQSSPLSKIYSQSKGIISSRPSTLYQNRLPISFYQQSKLISQSKASTKSKPSSSSSKSLLSKILKPSAYTSKTQSKIYKTTKSTQISKGQSINKPINHISKPSITTTKTQPPSKPPIYPPSKTPPPARPPPIIPPPPITNPPRTPPLFGLPGERTAIKPKPGPRKPKYNFLGNAPVSEISGLYGKRADILYGQKRTAKLVRIDITKSKKGNFVSLQGRRGLAHTPKPYFTKAKSKRKSKPKRWI